MDEFFVGIEKRSYPVTEGPGFPGNPPLMSIAALPTRLSAIDPLHDGPSCATECVAPQSCFPPSFSLHSPHSLP